ncbi:MAG: hypothetical protein ACOYOB_19295, partial [Myxococcota bacterium]
MISSIPSTNGGTVDSLLLQAQAAWRSWQAQVRSAGEDPQFARLFAERAAEWWAPVHEAALRIGLAALAEGDACDRPGADLHVLAWSSTANEGPAATEGEEAPVDPPPDATDQLVTAPMLRPPATIAPPPNGTPPLARVEECTRRLLQDRLNGNCVAASVEEPDTPLHRLRSSVGRTPKCDLDKALFRNQVRDLPAKVKWVELVALDDDDRHLALTWLAARLRMLQQLAYLDSAASMNSLTALARMLTRAVALGVSGHVHGLAHRHEPITGSWLGDALAAEASVDARTGRSEPSLQAAQPSRESLIDDAFRRLRPSTIDQPPSHWLGIVDELVTLGVRDSDVRWVGPLSGHLADVAGKVDRDRIRRAVTRAVADAEPESPLPESWPGTAATRGKRAMILGGDRREGRIPTLQARFEFASLDWPDLPEGAPRAVKAAVKKLKGGKYDFAIVLQHFIGHTVTDQVFRLKVKGL